MSRANFAVDLSSGREHAAVVQLPEYSVLPEPDNLHRYYKRQQPWLRYQGLLCRQGLGPHHRPWLSTVPKVSQLGSQLALITKKGNQSGRKWHCITCDVQLRGILVESLNKPILLTFYSEEILAFPNVEVE